MGWHGHVVPQHQVQVVRRRLAGEAHAQQRIKTAHALLHIRRHASWYETEELRGEDRHRVVTAKLRDASDEVDTADAILAVMPEIVEDDERPIGPATEHGMVETQRLDHRVEVISPQ